MSSALQRQYLLTCKVSGYFEVCTAAVGQLLLPVYLLCYVVAESQSADVIVQGCDDPNFQCLIGRGSLSRPMICLRCRSVYLRIFFITIVAMVSEAFKPRVRFSKAISIITKYCIDSMIDLISRVKHLLAFPSIKLSLWWFLKIILA